MHATRNPDLIRDFFILGIGGKCKILVIKIYKRPFSAMKELFTLLIVACALSINAQNDMLLLKQSGKVVIGDTTQIETPGDYFLYVQSGILTERVKVALRDASEWSDNAFDQTPSLNEVERSIENKNHLVAMPSAKTLAKEGYEVVQMDAKLLAQIEWLWQHTISLKKENEALKEKLEAIEKRLPRQAKQ